MKSTVEVNQYKVQSKSETGSQKFIQPPKKQENISQAFLKDKNKQNNIKTQLPITK